VAGLAWILLAATRAALASDITWVVERSGPGGLEQNAVVLEGEKVIVTKNSNFLEIDSGPGPVARIGKLELPKDSPAAKSLALRMRAVTPRLPLPKPGTRDPVEPAPHAVRVRINGVKLPPTSEAMRAIISTVQMAVMEPDLRLVHGARVERASASDCRPNGHRRVICEVKKFGSVYLPDR
jgi:hypothetical protein